MRRVRRQKEPSHPETLRTPLMDLVRVDRNQFIVLWPRVPWQDLAKLLRLPRNILFPRQAHGLAIADTMEAILLKQCDQTEIFGVTMKAP